MSTIAIDAAGAQRGSSLVSLINKLFAKRPQQPVKAKSEAAPTEDAAAGARPVERRSLHSLTAYECDSWLRWTGV